MVQAKGQAERYAKALTAGHGRHPFLLITDVGYCIEVFADFTGTGKAYAQFPDRASFRIMLDDLRDPEVRARLAKIWDAPASIAARRPGRSPPSSPNCRSDWRSAATTPSASPAS